MSKNEKCYDGELMEKGKKNEEIILNWLNEKYKGTLDFREFRLAQRIDVDFGIETIDGNMLLAEVKSDNYISEFGNLCFEANRINHFVDDKWFYLGWGWRSPAQHLFVRNPNDGITYVFNFTSLRRSVAKFISENSKDLMKIKVCNNKDFMLVINTDKQKTTFNYLIPMKFLKGTYKKYIIN
jgi:hypothetical protein